VDAVSLPPEDSLRVEVSYAIGVLTTSRRKAAAMGYLSFLATPEGQDAYARFGFVPATAEELTLKPIP
jgi:ABC-type molybdate transport system substrate-binding protein